MLRIGARGRTSVLAALAGVSTLLIASTASPATCTVPDSGRGTVELPPLEPPVGCNYVGDGSAGSGKYVITDGLPPGSTLEIEPDHSTRRCRGFFPSCSLPATVCEFFGDGSLGGTFSPATASVELQVTGTGLLAGFSTVLDVPLLWHQSTAPRSPGDAVQSFAMQLDAMTGQVGGGPDIAFLEIKAGSGLVLHSPGQTILTRLGAPGSAWKRLGCG